MRCQKGTGDPKGGGMKGDGPTRLEAIAGSGHWGLDWGLLEVQNSQAIAGSRESTEVEYGRSRCKE
jgi:hypothetical protein